MDRCQNCKYFDIDHSVGLCDCMKFENLTMLELEGFVNGETENCSQFEAYDEAEAEAEDRYYEELGGIFNV